MFIYYSNSIRFRLKIPLIESVLVLSEFPEAFPNDFLSIALEWKNYFCVYFLPNTNPISITPYRMALAEFKELKAQLKDLLEICWA